MPCWMDDWTATFWLHPKMGQHAAEIHRTAIENIFLDLMAVEGGIENTKSREISGWASEGKKIVVSFFFKNNLLFSIVCVPIPGIVSTVRMDFMATWTNWFIIVLQGLESWLTSPDYWAFFCEKLWGGYQYVSLSSWYFAKLCLPWIHQYDHTSDAQLWQMDFGLDAWSRNWSGSSRY